MPAFWMLGSNIDENGGDTSWPETGEIDIIELYGSKSPSVVEANIHYSDKNNKHKMMGAVKYELTTGDFSNSYNNFSIEWNKESINWFVNNEQYASVSIIGPEFTEFHKDFSFFLMLLLVVNMLDALMNQLSFLKKCM